MPEGLRLANKAERTLWRQYSKMKLAADWRTGDLCQLFEVVQITHQLRQLDKQVKREGYVVLDARGAAKENPLVGVISKMRAQRQSMMRGIGLTVSTDGKAHQAAKKAAVSVADEQAAVAKDKPSLLAVS